MDVLFVDLTLTNALIVETINIFKVVYALLALLIASSAPTPLYAQLAAVDLYWQQIYPANFQM